MKSFLIYNAKNKSFLPFITIDIVSYKQIKNIKYLPKIVQNRLFLILYN